MNSIIDLKKSKMIEAAKAIGIQPLPIKLFEDNYLYQFGRFLYYGEDEIHSIFYNLIHIPFQLSVSITFTGLEPRYSVSEAPRRLVVTKLLRILNGFLAKKYPSLAIGRNMLRAAWVVEFGKDPQSSERHLHLLLHFHKDVPSVAYGQVLEELKRFSSYQLSKIGIATLDTQSLAKGKAKCVSYFCKIEKGREFKKLDFSKGFYPIVRSRFVPETPLELGRAT
jgi:hypothetical protein